MIAVKTGHANFVRQSDVRIGLLREVVEKLQRGEKVDVEQVLGTGDPAREKEWEESKSHMFDCGCPKPVHRGLWHILTQTGDSAA